MEEIFFFGQMIPCWCQDDHRDIDAAMILRKMSSLGERIILVSFVFLQISVGLAPMQIIAEPVDACVPDDGSNKRVHYQPDHLVPVDPKPEGWHGRYTDALSKQLNMKAPFFARMVTLPSFEGESLIRLSGKMGEKDITKVDEFILTYYVADKNIWYSLPGNSDAITPKPVVVAVKSATFPKGSALRLHSIWEMMMQRCRPRIKPDTTLDGVTYEFATQSGKGEARNPELSRLSPYKLVALGNSLASYCRASADRRAEMLKQIEIQIIELDRYLREHPAR